MTQAAYDPLDPDGTGLPNMRHVTLAELKAERNWASPNSALRSQKPQATRDRLTMRFLQVLAQDFEANGKQAIEAARIEDPVSYVKTVASLLPKQVEAADPMGDMTDDELADACAVLRAQIAANREALAKLDNPAA